MTFSPDYKDVKLHKWPVIRQRHSWWCFCFHSLLYLCLLGHKGQLCFFCLVSHPTWAVHLSVLCHVDTRDQVTVCNVKCFSGSDKPAVPLSFTAYFNSLLWFSGFLAN